MSAAIFYTDVSDIITGVSLVTGSGAEITTNGSDGYIYGIELEGYWNISPQWTLSGFASWQDGRMQTPVFFGGPETEEYFSRLLPLSGSVALRWHHPSEPLWIEGRILASAEADHLSSSDRTDTQRIPTGGTPAYAVASLRAGWSPMENLELTAAIENLLDAVGIDRLHGGDETRAVRGTLVGRDCGFEPPRLRAIREAHRLGIADQVLAADDQLVLRGAEILLGAAFAVG